MNKVYRCIGAALGAALAVCSLIAYPVLRFMADACDRAACGIKRLDLELAHKFADKVTLSDEILSNLQRESHGFRQSSAVEPEGHPTWRTA
jgi:hypothetical protein